VRPCAKLAIPLLLLLAVLLAAGAYLWLRDARPQFDAAGGAARRDDAGAPAPLPPPARAPAGPELDPTRTRPDDERRAERAAVAGTGTVAIDGTVELWADFDAAAPLPPPSGAFELTVVADAQPQRRTLRVEQGKFFTKVPAGAFLEATKFELDGRTAWLNGDLRRLVPADGKVVLIALQLGRVTLHVVDGASGQELRDVTVLAASLPRDHPGRVGRGRSPGRARRLAARPRAVRHARCELRPARRRARRRLDRRRRPRLGARARVDFTGAGSEQRVALASGGALVVELRPVRPLDAAATAGLRIELTKAGAERANAVAPAQLAEPTRLDGLEPGRYALFVLADAGELGGQSVDVVARTRAARRGRRRAARGRRRRGSRSAGRSSCRRAGKARAPPPSRSTSCCSSRSSAAKGTRSSRRSWR
jgi:hypothetical protein